MTKYTRDRYILYISDPWDFGTQHGNGPFGVSQVNQDRRGDQSQDRVLIKLDHSLEFRGVRFQLLVVDTRHEGKGLEGLKQGHEIAVNITPISEKVTAVTDCFDLAEKWRGWILIGSLRTCD